MARLRDVLSRTRVVALPADSPPVGRTAAGELLEELCPGAVIREGPVRPGPGVLLLLPEDPSAAGVRGASFRPGREGGWVLAASRPSFFYAASRVLAEEWAEKDEGVAGEGFRLERPFRAARPVFDLFLAQYYRDARGWDREELVRAAARAGFTHLEVNGLAGEPAEKGEPGEVLHRFYTYCPALDQFAESPLNRGTYPRAYLEANMGRLLENAALAEKYGLTPALLCFEPRSVPESLLAKYPTLRGCRVDHPFRSFRPRFNLTTAHPAVLEHYAALLEAVMERVPGLGLLEIWSNDSGAAFEHTASLYAGRNGGAYLIREWRTHEEIARAAAGNILRFMKTLRDAGRRVNPDFRVVLRVEPFEVERPFLEEGLEEGLELSAPSALGRGWEIPYAHPEYEDVRSVGCTLWHTGFDPAEARAVRALEERGSGFHFLQAAGLFGNLEPLVGIPFPRLLWEKLERMARAEAGKAAFLGGLTPPSLAPFDVNREVLRAFLAGGSPRLEETLGRASRKWAGRDGASLLVDAWLGTDRVLRAFPVPVQLYAMYGFVWYRLWTRPLVPDIEALPEEERAYYEKEMLTTPHNPNRVDLARDVLFVLAGKEGARKAVERMDRGVFPALEEVRRLLGGAPGEEVFRDLGERLEALECWLETQRNVAAWIAGVKGYLEEKDRVAREEARALLRDAVVRERENARRLLDLWEGRSVEFMVVSQGRGNTFLHGEDFGEHLKRKIALMEGREEDEPRIDPEFLWRLPDLESW